MGNARRHFPFLKMKPTTKDNLIYLGVAGIIVAALVFYIFYTDRRMGKIPEIPGPILWGIFFHSRNRLSDFRALLEAPASAIALDHIGRRWLS